MKHGEDSIRLEACPSEHLAFEPLDPVDVASTAPEPQGR